MRLLNRFLNFFAGFVGGSFLLSVTGQVDTYGFTGGVRKLDVEEMIYLLSPHDVPFQGTYNTPNAEVPQIGPKNSRLPYEKVTQKKYSMLEDELLPARGSLNEALDTSETGVDVQTGEGKNFAIGHVIRIDDEFMRVSSISTDTLTVTRAFGSSTAATHADDAVIVGVGTALAEGSDPNDGTWVDPTEVYNVTQIFGPYLVETTGSEEAVEHYGVTSSQDYQVQKKIREMAIEFEQAIIYGRRVEDTSNKWRTMGGFFYFITTNVDSTTTSIDEDALLDQFQASYDNGGVVDLLAMGGRQKRNISAFNVADIQLARSDRVRGQIVTVYESDFGQADVMLNRHFRSSDLLGLDSQYASLTWLRQLAVEPLGKTGDSTREQIVCEKGLKLKLESRHFIFKALT